MDMCVPNRPPESPLDYRFGLEIAGGVQEQFLFLAHLFLKHTPELLSCLNLAVAAKNAAEVARQAHSLQGSAGAIGGRPLSACAGNLSHAARAGAAWAEIDDHRTALNSRCAELIAVLEEMVQAPTRG
jgi:HPt (histidine-containing phosphotransfer) domain-containing protein